MATKTNIPTKATGDNLTAAEFNELNSNYNTAVDDVNANKAQTEAEAIQLLRLHNPDLVFQGFATPTSQPATTTENHAWIVATSGTISGLTCTKGQIIKRTASAYVVEGVGVMMQMTNEVVNGDFSVGLVGVDSLLGSLSISVEGGRLKIVFNEAVISAVKLFRIAHRNNASNDLYYLYYEYESTFNASFYGISGLTAGITSVYVGKGISTSLNAGHTSPLDHSVFIRSGSGPNIPQGGVLYLNKLVKINLTKTFGAGNEPSRSEMDSFMSGLKNNYFSGTIGSNIMHGALQSVLLKDNTPRLSYHIFNGNFKRNIDGWAVSYGTRSFNEQNNLLVIGSSTSPNVQLNNTAQPLVVGDKYYISARVRVTNGDCSEIVFGIYDQTHIIPNPVENQWYDIEKIITTNTYLTLYFIARYGTSQNAKGKILEIDTGRGVVAMNLSEYFGKGNELTLGGVGSLLSTLPAGYSGEYVEQKYINLWLDRRSKLNSMLFSSEIIDGGFNQGIGNIYSSSSNVSISHEGTSLKVIFNSEVPINTRVFRIKHYSPSTTDLYYLRIRYSSNFQVACYGLSGNTSTEFRISDHKTLISLTGNGTTYLDDYASLINRQLIPAGSELQIFSITKINLTQLFGEGNEPSVDVMDGIFDSLDLDYIDKEVYVPASMLFGLFNKKMVVNKAQADSNFHDLLSLHSTLPKPLALKLIQPYFSPPEFYEKIFGNFPDPLKFYDESPVQDQQAWLLRQTEIKNAWHGIMGEWPELITDQELTIVAGETVKMIGYTRHKVTFEWVLGKTTSGYLLVPDGEGEKPAVVTVYYDPEMSVGLSGPNPRDFGVQLVQKGYVILSIGVGGMTQLSLENSTVQPLSMAAYAAANAWHVLAKVSDVDASRIGIVGHSYGGKWAMFASCFFDGYACGVYSDGGITLASSNYHEAWYLGTPTPSAPTGAFNKLVADGHDFTEILALMGERPFLVSGGTEDGVGKWVALNYNVRANEFLGFGDKIAFTNRATHAPTDESNNQLWWFLEYFLKNKTS